MTELLRELEAVVLLAKKATPGKWLHRQGTAVVILGQGAGGFDLSGCPQPAENAQAIASTVNFIRTHHTEIVGALADARRYRWLRMQSPVWFQSQIMSTPWTQWDSAIDAAIDAHNSAWEVGE